jgi:DNA-binding LacI/PurR family transcriptional regulator
MSVTIKDVARVAGVSHITVSRVLNGHTSVRPETRERVMKIADEMKYVPNYNARSLVLDKSNIIGLFFSTLKTGTSTEFFYQAVIGANSIIKDKYSVVIKGIDEYQDLTLIKRRNFDGILVMSQRKEDDEFISHVLEEKIPIVVMNRETRNKEVVTILLDDCQGAYEATRYLLQAGHTRIAIIEGAKDFESSFARKQGYIKAMKEAGCPILQQYMLQGDYGFESGYDRMQELLCALERPTAVFCFNDNMALGAIKAAHKAGVNVPEDISISGFDDTIFSTFITPALTTVNRPIEKMSQEGARRVIDILEKKESTNEVFYIDTQLKIRDSVKCI